ncbi:hypothetical protein COLSTE_00683 [Collinsella stercoris DSM 13279]|uniref:Uncharacterized protein n=1 Tax=Collinsella stercoris DSM 13279 TaxID=445975 RepID=B6G9E2_9ACTN|nr:hypothetical protein COLSTE_00683 [Collinsella stercoris DSM 13279]
MVLSYRSGTMNPGAPGWGGGLEAGARALGARALGAGALGAGGLEGMDATGRR